jgi:hypothetical protein
MKSTFFLVPIFSLISALCLSAQDLGPDFPEPVDLMKYSEDPSAIACVMGRRIEGTETEYVFSGCDLDVGFD